MHRGLTSPNAHSYVVADRLDAYTTRAEQEQLRLGNPGIHQRKRNGVEGRSHAAYHGYSHLSGIEMMSALFRCFTRGSARARSPARRLPGSPFNHCGTSSKEKLLLQIIPGDRLALHQPLIRADPFCRRAKKGVGLAHASDSTCSSKRENGSAWCRIRKAEAHNGLSVRGHAQAIVSRGFRPRDCGLTASAFRSTTNSWNASLK